MVSVLPLGVLEACPVGRHASLWMGSLSVNAEDCSLSKDLADHAGLGERGSCVRKTARQKELGERVCALFWDNPTLDSTHSPIQMELLST